MKKGQKRKEIKRQWSDRKNIYRKGKKRKKKGLVRRKNLKIE